MAVGEYPGRNVAVERRPLVRMVEQRLVLQHPLVGRRTHGEGADIGEEGLERTAVTARIRFEQPVETVLGIGDVAVDARRRVVLRFRHDRHHVSPVRQVHAPDRLDPLSRSCRRSCAPTTCEASGPGAGECGRVARRWPSRRAVGHRRRRFGERGLARAATNARQPKGVGADQGRSPWPFALRRSCRGANERSPG